MSEILSIPRKRSNNQLVLFTKSHQHLIYLNKVKHFIHKKYPITFFYQIKIQSIVCILSYITLNEHNEMIVHAQKLQVCSISISAPFVMGGGGGLMSDKL